MQLSLGRIWMQWEGPPTQKNTGSYKSIFPTTCNRSMLAAMTFLERKWSPKCMSYSFELPNSNETTRTASLGEPSSVRTMAINDRSSKMQDNQQDSAGTPRGSEKSHVHSENGNISLIVNVSCIYQANSSWAFQCPICMSHRLFFLFPLKRL